MSEASFASLGPTLLARKGGAKPAMRPQLGPLPETATPASVTDEQLEDLGWNDMGAEEIEAAPQTLVPAKRTKKSKSANKSADIVSINASKKHTAANEDAAPATSADAPAELVADPGSEPLIKTKPARKKSAAKVQKPGKKSAKQAASKQATAKQNAGKASRRAAFTLRLDADRHLKLRLAATLQGVSAQALVTEALDGMLSEIDDLDTLVASMSTRMKRH